LGLLLDSSNQMTRNLGAAGEKKKGGKGYPLYPRGGKEEEGKKPVAFEGEDWRRKKREAFFVRKRKKEALKGLRPKMCKGKKDRAGLAKGEEKGVDLWGIPGKRKNAVSLRAEKRKRKGKIHGLPYSAKKGRKKATTAEHTTYVEIKKKKESHNYSIRR